MLSTWADRKKSFFGYLSASGAILLASLIYEAFSHGVWSLRLLLACLFFLSGALFSLVPLRKSAWSKTLLCASLSSFTAYFLAEGILEIYGTTNRLTIVYPAAGALLLAACLFTLFRSRTTFSSNRRNHP